MKCPYCKVECSYVTEDWTSEAYWTLHSCPECGRVFSRNYTVKYDGTTEVVKNGDEIPVDENLLD